MGKDIVIRGVTRQGIETFSAPISGGGTAVFRDTSGADAVAGDLAVGKIAYGAAGQIIGTKEPPSGSISITENGAVDVTDYATALVNVQSGGGGPTAADAILIVTVPAGSTVTAEKGSVTLVPTLWTAAADSSLEKALFVIEPEQFDSSTPWTVTATKGTNTASTTVLITANKAYEVSITYVLVLYDNGTGSEDWAFWTRANSSDSACYLTPTMYAYSSRGSQANSACDLHTAAMIDVSDYASLKMHFVQVSANNTGAVYLNTSIYHPSSFPTTFGGMAAYSLISTQDADGVVAVDVSLLTGSYYIAALAQQRSTGAVYIEIDRVWLEH